MVRVYTRICAAATRSAPRPVPAGRRSPGTRRRRGRPARVRPVRTAARGRAGLNLAGRGPASRGAQETTMPQSRRTFLKLASAAGVASVAAAAAGTPNTALAAPKKEGAAPPRGMARGLTLLTIRKDGQLRLAA